MASVYLNRSIAMFSNTYVSKDLCCIRIFHSFLSQYLFPRTYVLHCQVIIQFSSTFVSQNLCFPGPAQFKSVQSLHRLGHLGDTGDDSAEILFQSCLREALVSSFGMGKDVHSLMLFVQHLL